MDVISEANRIKDRLSSCTTLEDLNAVAAEERPIVMNWEGKGGDAGTMFVHLKNLKKYMVQCLTK